MKVHFQMLMAILVLYCGPVSSAQTAIQTDANTGAATTDNVQLARKYLSLAGIEAPSSIDKSHTPDLTYAFRE